MTFEIRRVVTTHDAQGKAVVMVDAPADNHTSRRSGHQSQLIWMTDATQLKSISAMTSRDSICAR